MPYSLDAPDLTGRIVQLEDRPRGFGGYSDVYLADYDGRNVAVKVIRSSISGNPEVHRRKWIRETRVWSTLTHQHVLTFLGYCTSFTNTSSRTHIRQICLVSPWMEHGEAPSYLSDHPEVDRLQIVCRTASGLEYLHNNGIVHGDIKGANILINHLGTPLLSDFGLSTFIDSATTTLDGGLKGSARWIAYELLPPLSEHYSHTNSLPPNPHSHVSDSTDGEGEEDTNPPRTFPTDIWAFASTLIELLTLTRPYSSLQSDIQVVLAIMKRQLPYIPPFTSPSYPAQPLIIPVMRSVPHNAFVNVDRWEGLWQLCLECWDLDPSNRPTIEKVSKRLVDIRRKGPNDMILTLPLHETGNRKRSRSPDVSVGGSMHSHSKMGAATPQTQAQSYSSSRVSALSNQADSKRSLSPEPHHENQTLSSRPSGSAVNSESPSSVPPFYEPRFKTPRTTSTATASFREEGDHPHSRSVRTPSPGSASSSSTPAMSSSRRHRPSRLSNSFVGNEIDLRGVMALRASSTCSPSTSSPPSRSSPHAHSPSGSGNNSPRTHLRSLQSHPYLVGTGSHGHLHRRQGSSGGGSPPAPTTMSAPPSLGPSRNESSMSYINSPVGPSDITDPGIKIHDSVASLKPSTSPTSTYNSIAVPRSPSENAISQSSNEIRRLLYGQSNIDGDLEDPHSTHFPGILHRHPTFPPSPHLHSQPDATAYHRNVYSSRQLSLSSSEAETEVIESPTEGFTPGVSLFSQFYGRSNPDFLNQLAGVYAIGGGEAPHIHDPTSLMVQAPGHRDGISSGLSDGGPYDSPYDLDFLEKQYFALSQDSSPTSSTHYGSNGKSMEKSPPQRNVPETFGLRTEYLDRWPGGMEEFIREDGVGTPSELNQEPQLLLEQIQHKRSHTSVDGKDSRQSRIASQGVLENHHGLNVWSESPSALARSTPLPDTPSLAPRMTLVEDTDTFQYEEEEEEEEEEAEPPPDSYNVRMVDDFEEETDVEDGFGVDDPDGDFALGSVMPLGSDDDAGEFIEGEGLFGSQTETGSRTSTPTPRQRIIPLPSVGLGLQL